MVECKACGKKLSDGPGAMVDITTGLQEPFCDENCHEAYYG